VFRGRGYRRESLAQGGGEREFPVGGSGGPRQRPDGLDRPVVGNPEHGGDEVVLVGDRRRYLAPQDVEGYVARWSDLRTIVTITPDHVVSWSAGG
jgi:hypothetical protein